MGEWKEAESVNMDQKEWAMKQIQNDLDMFQRSYAGSKKHSSDLASLEAKFKTQALKASAAANANFVDKYIQVENAASAQDYVTSYGTLD